MKVTKGNILVEEIKAEEKKTAGGIIIPVSVQEKEDSKTREVSVVQVGDSISDIVIGNRLIVNKYAGVKVKVHDRDYQIITENDVLIIM